MKQFFITLTLVAMIMLPVLAVFGPVPALAQGADDMLWGGQKNTIQTNTGLGGSDPRDMASQVISIVLGFLGIVAVVIILLGGFRWMTAGGNEDRVSEARKLIAAGIIGLVIVLAAFGIAQFVLDQLYQATDAIG